MFSQLNEEKTNFVIPWYFKVKFNKTVIKLETAKPCGSNSFQQSQHLWTLDSNPSNKQTKWDLHSNVTAK